MIAPDLDHDKCHWEVFIAFPLKMPLALTVHSIIMKLKTE